MARQKIEMEPGGISPVQRDLWVAAVEKLDEATAAVEQMGAAQDRIEFEAGWTRLVDSLEEFWARFFDEGKSRFPSFQPWAGAVLSFRKSEPLLQYLVQARHQSQHGRIALVWEEGRLQVAPGFSGAIRGFQAFEDGTFEIDAVPAHPSVPSPTLIHSPGRPHLPLIENKKHGGRFAPPTAYRGQLLQDASPATVARIGIDYYSGVVAGALEKFGGQSASLA
ncbi:MAG: hypothetical protein Q7W51_02745 [Coriobacteriia bacterium]|nr:hypothetical protein [Coriobacteriia bacterium]